VTTAELAVRDEPRQMTVLTNEQLRFIAATEFVPPGLRGNLPAILACVATGRALGIADMSALRSIHIIDGKATFSAELMVQLVRRAGHSITGDVSDGSATVTGKRADNGDTMTSTWTLAMAERAGLVNKTNWKRYPEAMLWARAVSQLCRMLFADCFAGTTYTPEELDDGDVKPLEREPQPEERPAGATGSEPSTGMPEPSRSEPSITEPQKKKANVLVGQLRDDLRLQTAEVYLAAGHPIPRLDDGETLHWSPLRDRLTKKEANRLIDRLETYASSDALAPPVVDWLIADILAAAEVLGKTAEAKDAITEKRATAPADEDMQAWLVQQLERARKAAGS